MKRCPYCGEEVREEAIRCRFCGSDLREPPPDPTQSPDPAPAPPPEPVPSTPRTPEVAASTSGPSGQIGEGALQYSHSGFRYLLGYGPDFFGIWDREEAGGPVRRYPRTDEGWAEAWREFAALEPNNVSVGLGSGRPAVAAPTPPEGWPPAIAEEALLERLASPGRRFLARVIDALILVPVALVLANVFFSSGDINSNAQLARFVVVIEIISFAYEVSLIATRGQTLGKMAMGIKVVAREDGGNPGWGKAGLRWLLPALAGFVLFGSLVVYLWMLWDPKRQGLHDKLAGTLVIRV